MEPRKTINPHLLTIPRSEMSKRIAHHIEIVKKNLGKEKLRLLDIGGGKGWGYNELGKRSDIEYHVLDLATRHNTSDITFHQGDVCDPNLSLGTKFDIVFTKDTYEHVLNPWDSTSNILNLIIENGRFIFLAPFSWRYHASPFDTYRYSHTGARYLFERLGGLKHQESLYIVFPPSNGFWKNKKDATLDGQPFKSCIETFYVSERDSNYVFKRDCLDIDSYDCHTE
jgi:SAM-dependent methyltransferase